MVQTLQTPHTQTKIALTGSFETIVIKVTYHITMSPRAPQAPFPQLTHLVMDIQVDVISWEL